MASTEPRAVVSQDDSAPDAAFPALPRCANCGDPLQGRYCRQCGQFDRRRRLSTWGFLREAIGELFEADSRLWRTLAVLLGRPGLLSADYVAGKRARYMPPLRLYLAASIVYFLVGALLGSDIGVPEFDSAAEEPAAVDGPAAGDEPAAEPGAGAGVRADVAAALEAVDGLDAADRAALLDLLGERRGTASGTAAAEEGSSDVVLLAEEGIRVTFGADEGEELAPWALQLEQYLQQRAERFDNDPQRFFREVYDRIPAMLFLTLPLFALLTRMLWLGSGRWYPEQLVFALHLFALAFIVLTIGELVELADRAVPLGPLSGLLSIVVVVYLIWYWFAGFRRFFGCGTWGTLWRSALLMPSYGMVLLLAFLVVSLFVLLS